MWANLVSRTPLPDEQAESNDGRARMSAALASLPSEQSRALVLAAVYGYTAAEVSKVESVPLGTAKTRIRRGLMKLRACRGTTTWLEEVQLSHERGNERRNGRRMGDNLPLPVCAAVERRPGESWPSAP